jgi:hypothetical protein
MVKACPAAIGLEAFMPIIGLKDLQLAARAEG